MAQCVIAKEGGQLGKALESMDRDSNIGRGTPMGREKRKNSDLSNFDASKTGKFLDLNRGPRN